METEQQPEFQSRIDLGQLKEKTDQIRREISKVIVGQERMVNLLLTSILANGHVLIEGVPGVAKTLTAKILSRLIDTQFNRIQFTPDLMPSDILGTSVFNMKTSDFEFRKGPLFSNVVLIDEINRSPAKTQAALFEVMEERQITLDGKTYPMDHLFFVVATQNPIEQEGTYKLPEAQLDRFLFKIEVGYPNLEEEVKILGLHHENADIASIPDVKPVITPEEIAQLREKVAKIQVEKSLLEYVARIVGATRNSPAIYLGASPRASVAILNGAKAFAALSGRDFVTPEDIKYVVEPVVAHRIILAPETEMEGVSVQEVCKRLLDKIEVPR